MTTQPERDSIEIKTACRFIPEQSDVEAERYVFAYHITIRNTGSVSAQLMSRHCGFSFLFSCSHSFLVCTLHTIWEPKS